jgi:hypothetical protein
MSFQEGQVSKLENLAMGVGFVAVIIAFTPNYSIAHSHDPKACRVIKKHMQKLENRHEDIWKIYIGYKSDTDKAKKLSGEMTRLIYFMSNLRTRYRICTCPDSKPEHLV